MSSNRVHRAARLLGSDAFRDLVKDALAEVRRPSAILAYLRTLVLHGIALRLKQAFVQVGHGDERAVLAHVKLPLQFGGATDDIITVCEAGANGDGTVRGVVANFSKLLEHWSDGFMADCPNAQEDDAIRNFWSKRQQHEAWRALDPRDLDKMRDLAVALGLGRDWTFPPAALLRILHGSETVGPEQIDVYDLAREVEAVREALEAKLGREAQDWELVSAAVERAKTTTSASALSRLHVAYAGLDDAAGDNSLDADTRLAEQVHRIGARLCADGCPGCLHQSSELMSDSLVEVTVSRSVLQRFLVT